ncbi:hypothetical protein C5749_05225 [Sphingobacterium gobiense]|uniref:Uncharacterized protein n=2 Tax=Sphingobacterium gobiense TaxID=1382456 RepID=A0A2S9JTL9_9SPHI|nr:hypothetical protein C5749_05225 [Sphingobacterium gobiense]
MLLFITLQACQSSNKSDTQATQADSSRPESMSIAEDTLSKLQSKLRVGESLTLGAVYTDTVSFVDVNDDGDYFLLHVKKTKDTVGLLYDGSYDFVRGDKLAIQWKIDSIRPAGDPDFLHFTERLLSASVVKPFKLQPRSVKFLWHEERFMEEYDATVSTIVLDEGYVANISDPEKAALGYVATFIGNECAWDGKATPNRSNLKCKILTALDLGYQCSNTHLGFLRHWFRSDSTALKKLESCPTIPDGSTIQETFDKIDLKVDGNEIIVAYTIVSINTREGKSWTWDVKDHFRFHNNRLELVKTERSEPAAADFEVSDSDS